MKLLLISDRKVFVFSITEKQLSNLKLVLYAVRLDISKFVPVSYPNMRTVDVVIVFFVGVS